MEKALKKMPWSKAEAISKMTGEIVLADDSGLEIDYLNKSGNLFRTLYG